MIMTALNIAIVDYGLGNLFNLKLALDKLGCEATITSDKAAIDKAQAVVLPGVGAFEVGIRNLEEHRLVDVLRDAATKKPMLGICLGMQLLLSRSEEGGAFAGLDIIPGSVRRLQEPGEGDPHFKVPQIGWNGIRPPARTNGQTATWKDTPLNGVPDSSLVYFLHSYIAEPARSSDVLAITEYGRDTFCSAVHNGENVVGYQFHPERSGPEGREILRNFVAMVGR